MIVFVIVSSRGFFERSIAEGHEGIVLKNRDSTYQAGKRRRDGWVKVKRHVEFDAYVVGLGAEGLTRTR